MAEAAELELQVQSQPRPHRYESLRTAASHFKPSELKEWPLVIGAAVLLYFATGDNAEIVNQMVYQLLASVPAAVFTYRVLISNDSTSEGHQALMFYWSVYGILTVFDPLLGVTNGYYAAKLLVMSAVFFHAATKNPQIFQARTKPMTYNSVKTARTQYLTTVVSRYDSEGYPIDYPEKTDFSDVSVFMDDYVPTTACEITDRDLANLASMETTQPNFTPGVEELEDTLPPLKSHVVEAAHHYHTDSECTIALAYGDIVTNPMENVIFNSSAETKTVSILNVTEFNVMWALKSNALHHLRASPVCGLILPGSKEIVSLALNETAGDSIAEGKVDKLAIDYAYVPAEQRSYDTNFVQRQDKKRHLMRIRYEI